MLQRNRDSPGIACEKSSPSTIITASDSAVTPGLIDSDELPQLVGGDRRRLDRADQPADPQQRRGAGLEVDVRGALLHGEPDQLVEIHG